MQYVVNCFRDTRAGPIAREKLSKLMLISCCIKRHSSSRTLASYDSYSLYRYSFHTLAHHPRPQRPYRNYIQTHLALSRFSCYFVNRLNSATRRVHRATSSLPWVLLIAAGVLDLLDITTVFQSTLPWINNYLETILRNNPEKDNVLVSVH